jgi:uncharacterized protein (TIGR03067 family)
MRRFAPLILVALAVLLAWASWGSSPPTVLAQDKEADGAREKERAALQGAWKCLRWEEDGKLEERRPTWTLKGEDAVSEGKDLTTFNGKVELLDPTKTPARIDIKWSDLGTDRCIYVRAGDYMILCGNRDKPAPTEFKSGTEKGGQFLYVWKIER